MFTGWGLVSGQSDADTKAKFYIDRLARKKLGDKALGAWMAITDPPRNVLALRSYLLRADLIDAKWAWSDEEIKNYYTTDEYRQLSAEMVLVKRKFAELNPGFELAVAPQVRSLQTQLHLWNHTDTVKEIGGKLWAQCLKEIAKDLYPDAVEPDEASLARFQAFLVAQNLSGNPTVATPGLSDHGQLRALDFFIRKDRAIIADAKSATIKTAWDDAGWTAKLKTAVNQASAKFHGPLPAPYEPWHYTYKP